MRQQLQIISEYKSIRITSFLRLSSGDYDVMQTEHGKGRVYMHFGERMKKKKRKKRNEIRPQQNLSFTNKFEVNHTHTKTLDQ